MYNLINNQTGLIDFTETYIECLHNRTKLINAIGGIISRPDEYFIIKKSI